MILPLAVLLSCCTASPKYHGHDHPRPTASERRAARTRKPQPLPVAFSPPVRDFSVSRITSRFGLRSDSRYNTEEFHYGIDIKGNTGEKVIAAAPGTVTFAGRQRGFGKLVIIDHGHRISTVYGHLSKLGVAVGERIERGELIGIIGRTGNATCIHLHFEVRKEGKAINPLDYL
jgi:murein DD-endopeptidase MepM/ murein hydrolase activator NlpD